MKRLCLILGLAAAGCASQAMAQQNKINVGLTSLATDIALFVAEKRGYFTSEGLDVSLVNFQSAAVMIVPMTSGDIDVMAGAASAEGAGGAFSRFDRCWVGRRKTGTPTGSGCAASVGQGTSVPAVGGAGGAAFGRAARCRDGVSRYA